MKVIQVRDYEELSEKSCDYFVKRLKTLKNAVLGLATGSTPVGLYKRLIEMYKQNEISFKDVTTFNLDEYIGLDADHPQSYHYFMRDHLFKYIDIPIKQTHLPDGTAKDLIQECSNFEQLIREAGGIDLQVLGIGENGHIGFNEPGTNFDSRTDVTHLTNETIDANARFFNSKKDVPTRAITMGIGTIMEANEVILLASGENKADALKHVINGQPTEKVPATVLQNHKNITVFADLAALSKVSQ